MKTRARKSRHIHQKKNKKKRRRASALSVALNFKTKRAEIDRRLNLDHHAGPCTPAGRMWIVRARRRRFAISFVVPDRAAVEISDRKRVRGSRPLRIVRVPVGGSTAFHGFARAAESDAPLLSAWRESEGSRPDPKRAYHRSRVNDWYPQLLFCFT